MIWFIKLLRKRIKIHFNLKLFCSQNTLCEMIINSRKNILETYSFLSSVKKDQRECVADFQFEMNDARVVSIKFECKTILI